MLNIGWIRDNRDQVQQAADHKGIEVNISELLRCDNRRRALLQQVESLRQIRNQISQQIPGWLRQGLTEETEKAKMKVKEVNRELRELEEGLAETELEWNKRMLEVPNIVSPDTPRGRSDADNVEIARYGEPPAFGFPPLDHIALGEMHRMLDLPRGVKTAGTRSYYLCGAGALLHRAVQQLALDVLLASGFTLLEVPLIARTEALVHTGFLPAGEDQTYRLEGMDLRLVGTSEVPLVSYYSGEIVDVAQPVKLAAASQCFRSEAGSAGRDVHGLYRVHQFAKVEQVVLCEANLETAERLLQEITAHSESVLRQLELPYRVVAVCTGDMAAKTYKQYDLEAWMPSRGAYGETHSSSNLLDFQARRAGIRYRDQSGGLSYCYTLNNTAVASPRILIPLLENHQQEDGSIRIPAALRPYMNGLERLVPPAAHEQP
ncbi:serine--tRNA ligase [Paenibacillus filicis]|uniref:Serine--tRNA ligase n=1 Tax=Paenibacillus gyeongsangnamensis TaxID=3388067 RepID=A0ABT4Q4U2_9BACL|nr:serine--tRNA ligase [Paenibacillus filicis]MCZ8511807.1 serine--tRNA ligase [Paenibacillus filicis]